MERLSRIDRLDRRSAWLHQERLRQLGALLREQPPSVHELLAELGREGRLERIGRGGGQPPMDVPYL